MEIDFVKFLNATTRHISSREHEGKQARVLVASRTYETTVEDLWSALTDITRIGRWFLPVTGDLHVGGRFQFEGNAGGEILTCEAPSYFSVTWEFGGATTWVNVSLKPEGEGANLRLEHIATVDDETWNQYGPGAVGIGWEMGFLGLERHLGTGEVSDPQAAMAWMMSENGKSFSRLSSEMWADASIADGTPEEAARAAAARTTAAYTGEE